MVDLISGPSCCLQSEIDKMHVTSYIYGDIEDFNPMTDSVRVLGDDFVKKMTGQWHVLLQEKADQDIVTGLYKRMTWT